MRSFQPLTCLCALCHFLKLKVLSDIRAYSDLINGAVVREFGRGELVGDGMAATLKDPKSLVFMCDGKAEPVRTVPHIHVA